MNDRTGLGGRLGNLLSRGLTIPAWLLILIAIGGIFAPAAQITIPAFVWGLIAVLLLLVGWLSPQKGGGLGPQKDLYDGDEEGRRLTVSNHPAYANPTLLPIANRAALKTLPKEGGLEVITSVAGDLVFEVNHFATPVDVIIHYTEEDERLAAERQQFLFGEGRLTAGQEVRLIPVHLDTEDGRRVWKALANFERHPERREITVRLDSWGDKNIGVGTEP